MVHRKNEHPDKLCDQESPANLMEMTENLINVGRRFHHENLVRKMVRNIGLDSFIVNLCGFASETLNFRGKGKSPSMVPLIRKDDGKPDDQLKMDQTNEIYFHNASGDNMQTNLHYSNELTDVHSIIYVDNKNLNDDETISIIEMETMDGKHNMDDVRADAAAAVTVTDRDFAFDEILDGSGHEWVPLKHTIFTTKKIRFGAFSTFPVLRHCGMVGWQITHQINQKLKYENKKTRFSIPTAAACSSSACAE